MMFTSTETDFEAFENLFLNNFNVNSELYGIIVITADGWCCCRANGNGYGNGMDNYN